MLIKALQKLINYLKMTARQFCDTYKISFDKLNDLIRNKLFYTGLKLNQRIPDYLLPTIIFLLKNKTENKVVKQNLINQNNTVDDNIVNTKLRYINFLDGYIEFVQPKTNRIKIEGSKKALQTIFLQLKFLHNLNITLLHFNKLYLLDSQDFIIKVIEILEVENKFRFRNINYPLGDSSLPSWKITGFSSIFDSYKEDCVKVLFNISFESQIGYIPEVIIDTKDNILKTEPSLLVLIKNKKKYFFIWESLLDRKATYIFLCGQKENIPQLKATLIDFIGSIKLKNKRETLIKSVKLQLDLSFKGRIHHDGDYENWKIALMRSIR